MRHVRMPPVKIPSLVAWLTAGLLAAVAFLSPGPVAGSLLLILTFLFLAAYSWRARRTARHFRTEAQQFANNVNMLQTAEGLAGYGRWCIEIEPRRHLWSTEMCSLAGLAPGTPPTEETLQAIMPEGMGQLETALSAHAKDTAPYCVEFELGAADHLPRMLRANVRNFFSPEGRREQVFMVVRDVSEEYALQRDRDEAIAQAEQARKEAETDALTELANRRSVMAELDRAVVRARKDGESLSVIVFDVDHFKHVNDRHGHPAGDRVLGMIGKIAARQARERDVVGRIGGEEFLWIMPSCDVQSALRAAERLRWAIEAGTHSAPVPSVTISAGHAELQDGDAALTLFARADTALYNAKREGRNRVAQAA